MPLGTLDRTPPPFFRQGPSALTKLVVLLGAGAVPDGGRHPLRVAQPLRAALATALLPGAARAAACRCSCGRAAATTCAACSGALAEREARRRRSWRCRPRRAARAEQLTLENAAPARAARAAPGAAGAQRWPPRCCTRRADPYSRKVFIDRGATQGVVLGSPVINEAGVLGQVTRVYPLSRRGHAADRQGRGHPGAQHAHAGSAARPSAAGAAAARMELRFMAGQCRRAGRRPADHQRRRRRLPAGPAGGQGDARWSGAPNPASPASCWRPAASADGVRHVLVLEPLALQLPPAARAGRSRDAARPAKARADDRRRPAVRELPHDHAARLRPAAAAGQPLLHRAARCCWRWASTCCRWAATRRCPTCWRWCWCSGTCTSRAAWAWAWPSCSAC